MSESHVGEHMKKGFNHHGNIEADSKQASWPMTFSAILGGISISLPLLLLLIYIGVMFAPLTESESVANEKFLTMLFWLLPSVGSILGIVGVVFYRGSRRSWTGVLLNLLIPVAVLFLDHSLSWGWDH